MYEDIKLTNKERLLLERLSKDYMWLYRDGEGQIRFFHSYKRSDDIVKKDIEAINKEFKDNFKFLHTGSHMVNIASLMGN